MTTIIYLDVDGVINQIRSGTPSQKRTGWTRFERVKVNGYQIQYAPELVEALNNLAAREDVTIKWLTTWEHDAATNLSPPLGVRGQDWEVLTGDLQAWGGRSWWKLDAIKTDVAKERPALAVWIDDDIKRERLAMIWADTTQNVMAISPDESDGLTRDDIERIIAELERDEVETKA